MSDKRYFNFPISMIKQLYHNPKTFLDDVFDIAIMNHAIGLEYGSIEQRAKAAGEFFHVTFGSKRRTTENGRNLISEHHTTKAILTSLETAIFWDYYKADIISDAATLQLAGYLALRSIVGKKPFARATNQMLIARMFGQPKFSEDIELPDVLKNIFTRYHLNKLKRELRERFNLKMYAHGVRGFYFSFTMELESLVFEAEKRKRINKDAEYRKQQFAAREAALKKLNL